MDARLVDIPDEEYFALPSLDQSQLKEFRRNPAQWAWNRLHGGHEPTTAMRFGTAFHAYLLGTADVVALPEGETFKSARNKEWRDEQAGAGVIVVSHDDMLLLDRMRGNIMRYPTYRRLIEEGMKEWCIEWADRMSGLTLKAKPDLIPAGVPYLVDLKTAQSAQSDEFAKHAIKYGYHIQAEFYRAAVAQIDPDLMGRTEQVPDAMQFWTFEKTGACDWAPYRIKADSPMAQAARLTIRNTLNRIAEAVELGEGHGMGEGLDAAAHWCLNHGYGVTDEDWDDPDSEKTVQDLRFPDWLVRESELAA